MLSADFDYLMLLDVDVILLCRRPELTCEENGKKDVKQIKLFFLVSAMTALVWEAGRP